MVKIRFVAILAVLSIIHSAAVAASVAATTATLTAAQMRALELKRHNEYRARHRCGALQVNVTLDKYAQAYAESISKTHVLSHSLNATLGKYGENLYWSWRYPTDSYNGTAATESWYGENVNYDYKNGTAKSVGKTIGHFTAMIWNSTKTVGFGYAKVK
jgi:uncharacterized protein YkwD